MASIVLNISLWRWRFQTRFVILFSLFKERRFGDFQLRCSLEFVRDHYSDEWQFIYHECSRSAPLTFKRHLSTLERERERENSSTGKVQRMLFKSNVVVVLQVLQFSTWTGILVVKLGTLVQIDYLLALFRCVFLPNLIKYKEITFNLDAN